MVEERKCSFCGKTIEPGTGKMYVRKDGTVYNFDSNKCYKNMIVLKRVPRTVDWTAKAQEERKAHLKALSKADVAVTAAADKKE